MKIRCWSAQGLLACLLVFGAIAIAGESAAKNHAAKDSTVLPVVQQGDIDSMRIRGEQRFRANCGRCHAAPQKFPPRVMKTVVRHMRVRATITDEDMRMILFYMTQ